MPRRTLTWTEVGALIENLAELNDDEYDALEEVWLRKCNANQSEMRDVILDVSVLLLIAAYCGYSVLSFQSFEAAFSLAAGDSWQFLLLELRNYTEESRFKVGEQHGGASFSGWMHFTSFQIHSTRRISIKLLKIDRLLTDGPTIKRLFMNLSFIISRFVE